MLVASCDKEGVSKCESNYGLAELVRSYSLFVLPIPDKETSIVGVSKTDNVVKAGAPRDLFYAIFVPTEALDFFVLPI